jgi:hypothetical protein
VGDVFTMTLTRHGIRDNHVVEFEEPPDRLDARRARAGAARASMTM